MDLSLIDKARESILSQASQIIGLSAKLSCTFPRAVEAIVAAKGRVALCGMGKSGLIAQKISATLSSTGTPSYFIHAAEALHGDMGMLHKDDLLILISNSGQTQEIQDILSYAKSQGMVIIGFTGNSESTLGQQADLTLDISVSKEICPNNLAPTSSTLATLCLGDVLAVSVMEKRKFSADDFARLHPGGQLGRKLLYKVGDVMIKDNLPIVRPTTLICEMLLVMTASRLGLCLVVENDTFCGLVTDGDLRRGLQSQSDFLQLPTSQIMSNDPVSIGPHHSLIEAESLLMKNKIKALVVICPQSQKLLGVFDIFSL